MAEFRAESFRGHETAVRRLEASEVVRRRALAAARLRNPAPASCRSASRGRIRARAAVARSLEGPPECDVGGRTPEACRSGQRCLEPPSDRRQLPDALAVA